MSIYVGFYWTPTEHQVEEQLNLLTYTGANTVCIPHRFLEQTPLAWLRRQDIETFVDWTVFAGESLRQQYPDSVPIDATGTPFERDEWYVPVCPNHPQVRA